MLYCGLCLVICLTIGLLVVLVFGLRVVSCVVLVGVRIVLSDAGVCLSCVIWCICFSFV